MNRLPKILMPSGMIVLTLLLLTVFLASCGTDDPVAPEQTNNAPTAPAIDTGAGAPADAAINVALGAQLHWTCSDPDDDPLTYTVRFGTAAAPPAVAEDQAASSYTPTGLVNDTTYFWQIVAADDGAKSTSSPVWSFTTVAATSETISTPATPSGPASATTSEVPSYSTTGAISSAGHDVEYRFDWGDGTMSAWVAIGTRTHRWDAAGTYEVAAQARCAVDTAVETAWSATLTVTVTAGSETVSVPNKPTGQISGEPGVSLAYAVTGAGSSEGHAIEYRFDFGDGTQSDWTAAGTTSHAWAAAGNYNVTAQARCATHIEVESVWSTARVVTIAVGVETVSVPSAPTGPVFGEIDVALAYAATGAVSSEGHVLEYRFDWGDGTQSDWGAGTSITHAWTAAGSYDVTAQARCSVDTAIESVWSAALAVTVTGPVTETVSMPVKPSGATEGAIGETLAYTTSGAVSTEGHPVEYRIDWGDGAFSDWGVSGSAEHAWDSSGYYQLRAQARCQDHPAVESIWSPILQIAIEITETVVQPTTPSGLETLGVGVSAYYKTRGAYSTLGHIVEYRCDWGDGTMSGWASVTQISHAWDAAGTYSVTAQARCVEHPDIESNWSYALEVTVLDDETVSTPDAPVGPATSIIQEMQRYDFTGAASSWGHELEYRTDWGDGTVTTWIINDWNVHTWANAGTYDILVQARCLDHPSVESAWSAATTLVVSLPAEVVSATSLGVSPSVGGLDELLEFGVAGGYSNLDHPTEIQIDWGDGTFSDWGPKDGLTYDQSHAWTAAGTYQVTAHARCIEHPTIMSDWITPRPVEIIAVETVTAPTVTPSGEVTYDVGLYITVAAIWSASNIAHTLEYQVEINGTLTEWLPYISERLNTDVPTDYLVRGHARCAEHTDVVSDWSETTVIHIVDLENISKPTVAGPATGTTGVPVTFTVSGAESSHGHTLEYQLYWGTDYNRRDNPQGWTTADNLTNTWAESATYNLFVFVKARCVDHPEVESVFSAYHVIKISD